GRRQMRRVRALSMALGGLVLLAPGGITPGSALAQAYPWPGGLPGYGEFPGSGSVSGFGGFPGPGGFPGFGGYPGVGGYPGYGGYPSPGGMFGPGRVPGIGPGWRLPEHWRQWRGNRSDDPDAERTVDHQRLLLPAGGNLLSSEDPDHVAESGADPAHNHFGHERTVGLRRHQPGP